VGRGWLLGRGGGIDLALGMAALGDGNADDGWPGRAGRVPEPPGTAGRVVKFPGGTGAGSVVAPPGGGSWPGGTAGGTTMMSPPPYQGP
jgi:hypothetical protein